MLSYRVIALGAHVILQVLLWIFLEKIIKILRPLATALSENLGLESSLIDFPYLIAIVLILILCFIAGTIAKLGAGKWMITWIEEHVLTLFPGYQLMKNTMQRNVGLESDKNFPVVLVPIDGWMIAFQVDTLPGGELVVFVPSAPNTWEGSVVIFEKEQVKPSPLTQKNAVRLMRQLGVDASTLMKAHPEI